MKISIIITTHNCPDFLTKVLDGYLHQIRKPDQIVIADEGSGEDTRQLIEDYAQQAPFPIIHAWIPHKDKPRLSLNRNTATKYTTGEYIVYTDGDCIPGPYFVYDHQQLSQPGWFVQGKRNFVTYKAIEKFTGQENYLERLKLWMTGGLTKFRLTFRVPGLWREQLDLPGIRSCNLGVFRKDIEEINGWNEDFIGFWRQDSEFALRLMRLGVRRKNATWSAFSYHLEHDKPKIQEDIDRNDQLLKHAETAPIFTPNGLAKVSEDSEQSPILLNFEE
ncbi:MAG: glycosyltransferase [Pirellulales bacterium]